MANPTAQELADLKPVAAWKQVKKLFKAPPPKALSSLLKDYVRVLGPETDALDASFRKVLCAWATEENGLLTVTARAAMGKTPHEDYVDTVIEVQRAANEGNELVFQSEGESWYAWDNRDVLLVLGAFGDERATEVLETLLRPGVKVAHWDLLLRACVQCGSAALIPAVQQWRDHSARTAENPKWEGLKAADKALSALNKLAKKKKLTVPSTPRLGALEQTKKKKKKR